jgi:hypothetical protein
VGAQSNGLSFCEPAVCAHLAANALNQPLDKQGESLLIQLSGASKKKYEECFLRLQGFLSLRPTVSSFTVTFVYIKVGVQSIAVKFGCMEASKLASDLVQRSFD